MYGNGEALVCVYPPYPKPFKRSRASGMHPIEKMRRTKITEIMDAECLFVVSSRISLIGDHFWGFESLKMGFGVFNKFSLGPDTEIVELHHDRQFLVKTGSKLVENWQRYGTLKFRQRPCHSDTWSPRLILGSADIEQLLQKEKYRKIEEKND